MKVRQYWPDDPPVRVQMQPGSVHGPSEGPRKVWDMVDDSQRTHERWLLTLSFLFGACFGVVFDSFTSVFVFFRTVLGAFMPSMLFGLIF